MMKELSRREKIIIRTVTGISVLAALLTLFIIIGNFCGMGNGDLLIENRFSGEGKVDHETLSQYQYSRLMTEKAESYKYSDKRTEDESGNYNYEVKANIVNASGKRSDRFEYRNKDLNWGASQQLRMTNIRNMDGEATGYIQVDKETGIVSFDSVYDIEGEGKFYARAVDTRSGKPVTISIITALGNVSEWQHYNITIPQNITNPENWLCFCELYNENISPITGVKLYPIYANGIFMNLTQENIDLLRKFNVSI